MKRIFGVFVVLVILGSCSGSPSAPPSEPYVGVWKQTQGDRAGLDVSTEEVYAIYSDGHVTVFMVTTADDQFGKTDKYSAEDILAGQVGNKDKVLKFEMTWTSKTPGADVGTILETEDGKHREFDFEVVAGKVLKLSKLQINEYNGADNSWEYMYDKVDIPLPERTK